MDKIYFNKDKVAYAYEIDSPLCIIDVDIWSNYCEGTLGIDYDIIDGVFTPLRDISELNNERLSEVRTRERYERYQNADDEISKCDNYIFLNIESEHYTELRTKWMRYKMDVRQTTQQDLYPSEVVYPDQPS